MPRWHLRASVGLALVLVGALTMAEWGRAQSSSNSTESGLTGPFREVPVSHLLPNGGGPPADFADPAAKDPASATRGMQYFSQMNCIGCHAPNGGGGMGPALSNNIWIYGDSPANIYLTIVQGRPNGMPAFGELLPDEVVWDLVSYIESIKEKPGADYGATTSLAPQSPKVEQVPAEAVETTKPWDFTQPFMNGQKPPASGTQ
jgi:cytochrome c oxidase cbb3-type subunit III